MFGVEVYLCPSPEPEEVAKRFIKSKPNHFTGGPAHILELYLTLPLDNVSM